MGLKSINFRKSYISYGDENIADNLVIPALKEGLYYRRSVGFFSSSVLDILNEGIIALFRKGGKIELITSPRLSAEDVETIKYAYQAKGKQINDLIIDRLSEEIEDLDDKRLHLLAELIINDCLEMRIAITKDIGIYHDKLGIIEDEHGDKLVFYGSANSSFSAYKNNYEKVRISRSWIDSEKDVVEDEVNEFNDIWEGRNPHIKTLDIQEAIRTKIVSIHKERQKSGKKFAVKLRDYQEEAIASWVKNDYKGFYVMATGTGKTWTAIFSAKELIKNKEVDIIICAPYKHLVKQWADDIKKVFSKAKMVLVSSENSRWEEEVSRAILAGKHIDNSQMIIISTIMSFNSEKFKKVIGKSKKEKLLIVDEAHRFKNLSIYVQNKYKYMLGLSATPMSGKDSDEGAKLIEFFGGLSYNLPIEEALLRGFLVKYNYYPIFINATSAEEQKFKQLTQKISSCFKNGTCIDLDSLLKYSRARLRIISMASEKIEKISYILDKIKEKDHFVVYCGDGRLFNENRQEETRHIQFIKDELEKYGYKSSQFTASEDMSRRIELVDQFNNGEISALVAIRCLDEGINIPSIKSALILSSNDNYREFVQRRGRILRKYNDKEIASIFDVIVLPSIETQGMATIELRRFYEYAKLAINKEEQIKMLEELLGKYSLNYEDIDIFKTEVEEDILDE